MERAPRGSGLGPVVLCYDKLGFPSSFRGSLPNVLLQEEPTAMDFYRFSFWKSAQHSQHNSALFPESLGKSYAIIT